MVSAIMKNLFTILLFTLAFSCFGQNVIKQIPFKSDALFWLDGKVSKIGANYYFIDKTGNGRNFLITNYDFDSTSAIKGFPYKSSATISAPSGDATLIVADVNSFLYTAGTPNQLPVVSLFQDVDYEHKLFTRHKLQTVSNDSIEMFEPRVYDVVLYNTVKTSLDLTKCQIYYRVPAEIAGAIWYSPSGNNTTGTGTKSNPYLTLAKNLTTHFNVYCKSGTYDFPQANFSAAALLSIYGTGFTRFSYSSAISVNSNRPLKFKNIIINGNGSSTNSIQPKYGVTFENCSLIKTSGTSFISTTTGGTMGDFIVKNCVLSFTGSTNGLFNTDAIPPNVSIVGCYGALIYNLPLSRKNTSLNIAHNKFTAGYVGGYSNGIRFQDNKITGTASVICAVNSTLKYNKLDSVDITTAIGVSFYKNIAKKVNYLNCANNQIIRGNVINAVANSIPLKIITAQYLAHTGLVIDSNVISGNSNQYLVYVTSAAGYENSPSGYLNATFSYNTITNTSIATTLYQSVFLRGRFNSVRHNNLYGAGLQTWTNSNSSISDNYIKASQFIKNIERVTLVVYDTTGAMSNNVNILNNTLIGNIRTGSLVLIGSSISETDTNAFDSVTFVNNKVVNEHDSTLTGSGHTVMFDGGHNFNVKYNDITFSTGYAIVLKAGGGHYLYDIPHLAYNIFRCVGNSTYIVYNRGAYGANFANNTILNYKGFSCFNSDGNFSTLEDNLLNVKNNIIQLGGNVGNCYSTSSTYLVTNNNYYAKNGYVFTGSQQDAADYTTLTSIDTEGVPATRINGGITTTVTQGIGIGYSIPASPIYTNQDATWQVGAVIK